MKNGRILLLIALILSAAMLACTIDLGQIQDDVTTFIEDAESIRATVEAVAKEFEDFPIPEKISNFKASTSGFSFDTQISIDEVIDYYVDKMGGLGYIQLSADQIEGEQFTFVFGGSDGNERVQLVLNVISENEVHVEVTFL